MKHIIGIVTILLAIVLSGCTDTEKPEYWTWELSSDEEVNITFTSQMINCTGSDKPSELFASVLDTVGKLSIFQEYPTGSLSSWLNDRPDQFNNLKHIQPDIPCSVRVENNCTFCIEKC